MATKNILFILFLFISFSSFSQNEININKLHFKYEIQKDSIYCFLSAPTKGWVMLGFNDTKSISNADLKFFAVVNHNTIIADHKNIGARNYRNDTLLKGRNDIHLIKGIETKEETQVHFIIPLKSKDPNDFQHEISKPFWLILAYSTKDDFMHHSIFRKHLPLQWESL